MAKADKKVQGASKSTYHIAHGEHEHGQFREQSWEGKALRAIALMSQVSRGPSRRTDGQEWGV